MTAQPEGDWFEEVVALAGDPVALARARYLAAERRALHLWMRVLTRLYLAASPARRRYGARIWMLCAGWIGVDLLVGEWMRRFPDRQGTTWRLPLDLIDMTWWSKYGPDGRFDSGPAILAVPLIAETTIRVGPSLATLCAGGLDSLFTGLQWWLRKPVRIRSFRWHAMAILAGIGLRAYADRHFTGLEQERDDDLRALWNERYRVGQQQVVDGVDGIGDYLGRLHRWLRPEHPQYNALVEAAEVVRDPRSGTEGTRHLVTVVKEWAHNHGQGDQFEDSGVWVPRTRPLAMADYVALPGPLGVAIDQREGLTKVSSMQRRRLILALETQALDIAACTNDELVVRLTQAPIGPVGSPFTVTVNGLAFEVPADDADTVGRRAAGLVPYDPVAVAFILGAGWQLNMVLTTGGNMPAVLGAGLGLASAAIGWTIHQRLEGGKEVDPFSVVLASTVFAGIGTVIATRTMRMNLKSDGVQASTAPMELPALVVAINWHQLSPPQRRIAAAIAAASILAGWLMPRPMAPGYRPNPRHLLLNLLWPTMAIGPARNFHASLSRETSQLEALEPVQRSYVEAAAELAGTADQSRDAIILFRRASAEASQHPSHDERRLRRLAAVDARRIERHARNLEEAVNDRLTRFQQQLGAGTGTSRILGATLTDSLLLADRLERPVVAIDLENTLTGYKPSAVEAQAAMRELVEWAEARTTCIRKILFLSNAPLGVTAPEAGRIEVTVLSRAGKPWVGRRPLARHRRELEGAVVCGDQLFTDGLLAHRVHGLYVDVARQRGGPSEPWWPRVMRAAGEVLLRNRFSVLRQDSPLLGVSIDPLDDLVPNPSIAE